MARSGTKTLLPLLLLLLLLLLLATTSCQAGRKLVRRSPGSRVKRGAQDAFSSFRRHVRTIHSVAVATQLFAEFLAELLTTRRSNISLPIGCRDQNDQLVDWYVVNKLPKLRDAREPFVADGEGFMHFSSAFSGEEWAVSDVSISSPSSAVGLTLDPIYFDLTRQSSLIYAFYNDAPPSGRGNQRKGHTKGVVVFDIDSNSGFWLVHSVPHYPPPPGEHYSYPSSGRRNGQSLFCMTLSSSQLETVAEQLHTNCPLLYATRMPDRLKPRYPTMTAVLRGNCEQGAFSTSRIRTLRTSPVGQEFISFAKTRGFAGDLYSDLVAPQLQTDLFTETWMSGAGTPLPSDCSRSYWVWNVGRVNVSPPLSAVTPYFNSTLDHSKWAVSADPMKPWVCIGDINRMQSQADRSGGTVCHKNRKLWQLYYNLVGDHEVCHSAFDEL